MALLTGMKVAVNFDKEFKSPYKAPQMLMKSYKEHALSAICFPR